MAREIDSLGFFELPDPGLAGGVARVKPSPVHGRLSSAPLTERIMLETTMICGIRLWPEVQELVSWGKECDDWLS
jgi:hypothetical protein